MSSCGVNTVIMQAACVSETGHNVRFKQCFNLLTVLRCQALIVISVQYKEQTDQASKHA